jgi:ABC-type sulfate transport system substrate-binding protein
METKDNKTTITKIGTKPIQRDQIIYEFTTVLSINAEHKASCIKDRSGFFSGKSDFLITENTGKQILDWCNNGLTVNEVKLFPEKTISNNSNSNNYGSITVQAS